MTAPEPTPAPALFSPRNSGLIRHWALGGAALGGGTALVTSLLNYLGTLRDEKEEAEGSNDDEDTLYLNLHKKKPTTKMASIAGSVAMAGGVMAALGSYAVVRQAFQKMKKDEMKRRLAAAQQGFVDVAGDETKSAAVFNKAPMIPTSTPPEGKPMGMPETLMSMPGAGAILLALASGAVTTKMLEKTFPNRKPPGRRDPRRVVIRDEETMPEPKEASDHSDGEEFVYRLLLSTKSAALREFKDIVHAIGQGRHSEVCDGLLEHDIAVTQDMVKGASLEKLEEPYLSMAVGLAARSELAGPSLRLLAAGEFNEHFPSMFKLAAAQPPHIQEALCGIADAMGAAMRYDAFLPYESALPDGPVEKNAGALFELLDDALLASTANNVINHPQGKHKTHPDENAEADPEPESEAKKPQVVTHGTHAKTFEEKNKDQIDAALAP